MTIPTTTSGANANGKRPLSTLDSNGDPVAGSSRAHGESQQLKTHEASGYSWLRQEDEPGWGWRNKKAVDEAARAYDSLVYKDKRIGNRWGDPFEIADRELAVLRSQQER
ncbi:hypothetical protein M8818_006741 [Zalaria obscura]|uniref:Uncharacterized protein n=1 Tax=Zalaria obscura TaxID=2024903 RepID=A0ACC3S4S6_9PEZI